MKTFYYLKWIDRYTDEMEEAVGWIKKETDKQIHLVMHSMPEDEYENTMIIYKKELQSMHELAPKDKN